MLLRRQKGARSKGDSSRRVTGEHSFAEYVDASDTS
jgi:hypothetical protein